MKLNKQQLVPYYTEFVFRNYQELKESLIKLVTSESAVVLEPAKGEVYIAIKEHL